MRFPPFSPSPRDGVRNVLGTRGIPPARFGQDGDLATDPTTGKLYLKSKGVWTFKGQGFNRLFVSQNDLGLSSATGDPLLPNLINNFINYGNVSISLNVTSAVPGSTVLGWNYPSTMVGGAALNVPGIGPGAGTKHWPGVRLYLVRCALEGVDPNLPDASMLFENALTLSTGDMDALVAAFTGVSWTVIQTWNSANMDAWPITFTDSSPATTSHINNYRLIAFIGYFETNISHNNVFDSRWIGLIWNSVYVSTPYNFVADGSGKLTPYVDAAGVHLAWA